MILMLSMIFAIIVIIALLFLCYASYKITHIFGERIPWWFGILHYLFVYELAIRIGRLFVITGTIPMVYDSYITAAGTVFWVGIAIFLFRLYQTSEEVTHR
jgi:hypothetical protein